MARSRVAATLRSTLFNTSSVICLSKARHLLLPIVAGAAFAIGGTAFTSDALAAAGVCAPDASGTPAATGPIESCSGDFATGISYPGALGTGGNFEVDLNSVTNTADGGVIVSGGGAVNVTVTQFAVAGNITNLAGNGIQATNFGGNIAITTVVGGNVTASGIGIYGEQLLAAGSGSVTISVAGNISGGVAGAGAGIVGQVQGDIGDVSITTAAGTAVSGTVVSANGYTALVDSNVAIYASAPDGDANEIAGNVTVSLGDFTAVTLTNATNGFIGGAGISADTFGDTGNVNVTLGNGATITLNDGTGNDASGIYAVAQDKTGGNLITGNVAVTLNDSAVDHTAITVTGDNNSAITARNEGGGALAINTGANNDLVVTGDTSFGIIASGLSTGAVNVTTGVGSDITVNAGDGAVPILIYSVSAGVTASGNGGNVAVTTNGNVTVLGFSSGNVTNPTIGVLAETTGAGNISVAANGAVSSQRGQGIDAFSIDGNITVTTSGPISATTYGVRAVSSGNGSVSISNSGNITQPAIGLVAATSSGVVQVDNSGNIGAGIDGIYAESSGGAIWVGYNNNITGNFSGASFAGIETVNTTGNTSIANSGNMSGLTTAQYGIKASSVSGQIQIVNTTGAAHIGQYNDGVSKAGIDAVSSGANTSGISITNIAGDIYVDGSGIGNQYGIHADNAGSGDVSIVNYIAHIGIFGGVAPDYGIWAQSNGGVSVESYGGGYYISGTVDGIHAESPTGSISIGAINGIHSAFIGATNAGINAVGGSGNIVVWNGGDMVNLGNALFGVRATSSTGSISVVNGAQIGSGFGGPGNGVNTAGIWALSSGANSSYVNVTNSGKIYVDGGGATYGIVAVNAGTGTVNVQNYEGIDPPAVGIYAEGLGAVNVTNTYATISAETYGVRAHSTGLGNVTVLENMLALTSAGTTSYYNPNIVVSGTGNFGIDTQSVGGDVLVSGTGRDLTGNGTSGDDGLAGNVTLTDGLAGNATAYGILASTGGDGTATVRLAAADAGNATVLANTRGTVTVNSADGATAIGAGTQSGDINIILLDNTVSGNSVTVTSTSTGAGNAGILADALAAGTSGNVVIDTGSFNNLTVSGDNSIGIRGRSTFGNVSVTTGTNSSLSVAANASGANEVGAYAASYGIAANVLNASATSTVTVTNNAAIAVTNNAGSGAFGISAVNLGSGTASVLNYSGISSTGIGIDAEGNGNVSVTNDAANISATTIGVNALSGPGAQVSVLMNMSTSISGNVTTFNNPNITVTAGTHGISAQSLAGGNVLVSGTGRDLAGNGTAPDDGLAGNVSLTDGVAANVSTAYGIYASTVGNGTATVRLAAANAGNATFGAGTRGAVTVDSADFATAISAATQSGSITIALLDNTVAGSSIAVTSSAGGAGNAGISANATAPGNATVSGGVVINTGNFNNVSVSGDNSVGILGQSSFGNVTITTGTNSSLTVAANSSGGNESGYSASYGIVAGVTNAGATGNVTVTSNAVVTVTNNAASSTIGINATNSGTGTLSVFANAAITSNGGSAIRTVGGAGPVTINNSVLIRGLGASAGTAVVNVSSNAVGNTSAATITINNNATGVIASVGGLAADFAIGATTPGTGTVNVFNAGRITGAVNFSGATAVAFNNSSATSWHTSGNSTFTNGYDALNNQTSGRIATSGATAFNFMDSAIVPSGNTTVTVRDDFINSGTLVVGETSGASSLTITKGNGTLTMSNSGTIILGGQSTGLNTDGQTNDQLLAKGANMTFAASSNSRLKIDAFLGAGAEAQSSASTGCSLTAAFADCMSIGASTVATGSVGTRVSINDTNSAGGGAINLPGTVIVDGISGAAGDFFLSTADPNVVNTPQGIAIRKGFVLYQLIFDPTNVDWDLVGMPAAETFELSKVTAGLQTVWHETADGWNERTSAIRHDFAMDSMTRAWTIWGKAYYGQADRDSENTIDAAGNPFSFDTTYSQSYGGIQFGADVSRRTANGAWAVGGLFGYNKTRVEFDASTDSIDGTVINVGAYGSFMAGPFFADVLVKDDIATLDFDLPAYAGVDNVDANSIGAELTFGGRFGRRIVFEPLGTLAYVKTAVGNLDSAGMNFNWEDGTSFRGIFALRLSGELGPGQTRLQPFILGGIGREFDGENNLLLSNGGSSLSIMDKPIETFGVASLGLNVLGTSGWSGFIRADGLFAPDYHSAAIRVGMRIR